MRLSRQRLILHATAGAVTLAVLAPLVQPGYALSYDMVFVPNQPLTWDIVAPAGGLPRAVPQDLVVSLLSMIAPGWLLQRLFLAGAIYAAAYGAGRLVPTASTLTRVVAAVGYAWTPFLAERLLIGQWGLLLAYGALPWLVAGIAAVRAHRAAGPVARLPAERPLEREDPRSSGLGGLTVAAAVGSITPTGGLVMLATVAVGLMGVRLRTYALGVGAVLALNLPWLLAGALADADGRSDPAGVAAFAARAENWSGPLGALLGTGGIWNAQTTPDSRGSFVAPLVTAVLLALAVAGFGRLRERWSDGSAGRLAGLAGGGLVVAALGVFGPTADLLGWLVGSVPGAGLLRDGQKFVLPYALLLAVTVALGAERLAGRLGVERGRLVLLAVVAMPVVALPDLAFGGAGALRPVTYPADWDRVADLVAQAPGEVVTLPLAEYRRYPWNGRRTVIDVAPRYLPAPVTMDDRLVVGAVTIDGESERSAQLRRLVEAGRPVADSGARWVLVQRDSSSPPPAAVLAGLDPVYTGPELTLYRNPAAAVTVPVDGWRRTILVVGHIGTAAVLFVAVWSLRRKLTAW